MMEKLLKIKAKLKKKMPDFTRTDSHKKQRLGKKWRKPKGIQNKMRKNIKGYKRSVSPGYRTPKQVRGMESDGKKAILVSNISDLEKVSKGQKALISSGVGARKKMDIIIEIGRASCRERV